MLLRQSQLFEVFVRERLEMFAMLEGGPELSGEGVGGVVWGGAVFASSACSVQLTQHTGAVCDSGAAQGVTACTFSTCHECRPAAMSCAVVLAQ